MKLLKKFLILFCLYVINNLIVEEIKVAKEFMAFCLNKWNHRAKKWLS